MDNATRHKKLKEQIELRIELLQKKTNGELSDVVIPTSLTKLRRWENKEYGIDKVGSPSSFVTTHQDHGRKILQLQKLLGQLRSPKKSKTKPLAKKYSQVTQDNLRLKELLQSTANQYVQYSHEFKRLKENAVLSKSLETGLREEINELREELAASKKENSSLRKKLLKHGRNLSSKVTQVDFGGED